MSTIIADYLNSGAGKSSLIRLLIDPDGDQAPKRGNARAAPVVGRSTCEVPTSADVHLYADPETYATDRPILYADCEGFDGGERDTIASLARAKDTKPSANNETLHSVIKSQHTSISAKLARGTKRLLKWARRDSPDYENTSKRGYAVQQMYPRIFYAFSDVVVFVLTNQRQVFILINNARSD